MSISYYTNGDGPRQLPTPLRAIISLNLIFGTTVLSAWTSVAAYIVEPIAWMTGFRVYPSDDLLSLVEYPFVLHWGLPFGAIPAAWVACNAKLRSVAYASAVLPIVLYGSMFAWYHLAPITWR